MNELEIWVRFDAEGNYVIAKDEGDLYDLWESEEGTSAETRTTKIKLETPESFPVTVLCGKLPEPVPMADLAMSVEEES